MSYVHKNTTLVLFFLLLVSIIFLSSSVIIYQRSMTRLNDDVRIKNNDIRQIQTLVNELQLNSTSLENSLNLLKKREENLSEQFVGLKDEKEELFTDFESISKNYNKSRKDLDSAKFTIADLQNENLIFNFIISK